MNIMNLTPHDLNVVDAHGDVKVIVKGGQVARVATTRSEAADVAGFPTSVTTFGEIEGLPAPQPDTIYIVSGMVAARCGDRDDVLAPGELVRDATGAVIGCRGFSRG